MYTDQRDSPSRIAVRSIRVGKPRLYRLHDVLIRQRSKIWQRTLDLCGMSIQVSGGLSAAFVRSRDLHQFACRSGTPTRMPQAVKLSHERTNSCRRKRDVLNF
jgi:hypothetical protein